MYKSTQSCRVFFQIIFTFLKLHLIVDTHMNMIVNLETITINEMTYEIKH
jgi:hypothetical protein